MLSKVKTMNLKCEKLNKILSIAIFTIYLTLLVWVILLKCNVVDTITKTYAYFNSFTLNERFTFFLVPFADYFGGPFIEQIINIVSDDVLNVIIFLPIMKNFL